MKCAGNDDTIILRSPDDGDKITMVFEAKNESEVSEYEIKLMNIDSEYLGIPVICIYARIRMTNNISSH